MAGKLQLLEKRQRWSISTWRRCAASARFACWHAELHWCWVLLVASSSGVITRELRSAFPERVCAYGVSGNFSVST